MVTKLTNPVIYQIYPRSFVDSNGDGDGDVRGIISKLDYLHDLGVNGIWLNPIYKSPMVDMGYDISDYREIDPMFGNADDVAELVSEAHKRNIAVLLDMVPCHTSIEHPWFREHPDWYVWSPIDGIPNNWLSAFGGPAWSKDEASGKWYLHIFYPEQPALNFHKQEVRDAVVDVMQFWFDRGVDGFRLDAVQFLYVHEDLRDWEPIGLGESLETDPEFAAFDVTADYLLALTGDFIGSVRKRFPEKYFVTEATVPIERLKPFIDNANATFYFEFLLRSLPNAETLRPIINAGVKAEVMAWCLGNHDFTRLVTRWGDRFAPLAAVLLCTMPGSAFIYMGDEIGMSDGPGATPRIDRFGRDRVRHPMQWTSDGGFSDGTPWLPMHNPAELNVLDQLANDVSLLNLYRELLKLRISIADEPFHWLHSVKANEIAYSRGNCEIRLDFDAATAEIVIEGKHVLLHGIDGVRGVERLA